MIEFDATVRNQPSPFGKYGKITSKRLAELVGKEVIVRVLLAEKAASEPKKG